VGRRQPSAEPAARINRIGIGVTFIGLGSAAVALGLLLSASPWSARQETLVALQRAAVDDQIEKKLSTIRADVASVREQIKGLTVTGIARRG
jgi:hypothetical protein